MLKLKVLAIGFAAIGLFVGGAVVGSKTVKPQVIEKEVIKVIRVKDTTKTVKKPDGTTIVTVIKDRTDKATDTTPTTQTSKVTRWTVSALAGMDFRRSLEDLRVVPSYGAHIQYRPFEAVPLKVGAFGLSSGVGGLSLGVEF